ncbi:MAG: TetR/AcrR family transcriptional regulator [Minisyncoccia bacterium]
MEASNEKIEPASTKNLIIDVAEQLFAKFGYLGVSMSDIAKSLEITKAALYYHFSSKEDLFLKVLSKDFEELSGAIKKLSEEDLPIQKKFCRAITVYIDISLKRKGLAKLTMQKLSKDDDGIIDFIAKTKIEIANQLEPIVREFFIYKKKNIISSKVATYLLIGMLNTFILGEILEGGKNWKAKDIATQINALFFS